jgi:hypothetical protein
MHHYASQLVDLLLVLVAAWMVLAIIFFIYAYFAGLKYPVSESVFGTRDRHFLLHHNDVDLAPHCCGRFNPIADRLFVVPLQGKTTRVTGKKRCPGDP